MTAEVLQYDKDKSVTILTAFSFQHRHTMLGDAYSVSLQS
jgi:hypothetical protein